MTKVVIHFLNPSCLKEDLRSYLYLKLKTKTKNFLDKLLKFFTIPQNSVKIQIWGEHKYWFIIKQ